MDANFLIQKKTGVQVPGVSDYISVLLTFIAEPGRLVVQARFMTKLLLEETLTVDEVKKLLAHIEPGKDDKDVH
jgi:hypothetical protein